MNLTFINRLREAKIIPIIRHNDHTIARDASILLAQEGVTVLEITSTVPDFSELISELHDKFPAVEIGAGTVLTEKDANMAIKANAKFLVSPCWREAVSQASKAASVPYLPGAMTVEEVYHHHEAGAEIIKVFPVSAVGGPEYISALCSVFPGIPLMPTGGVTVQNAHAYFKAGAHCIGIGGGLFPAKALEEGKIKVAREQISAALNAVFFHE